MTHRHPTVCVVNHSTGVTDDEVARAIVALQRQVTYHFAPYWNAGCTLLQVRDTENGRITARGFEPRPGSEFAHVLAAKAVQQAIPAGAWLLTILDDSDQAGALGYHEVDPKVTPIGYVFAKTDREAGLSWTVTTSHELLEMLVDPLANLCAELDSRTCVAYESADAVEADELGYTIDGVLVSDFMLPAWFVAGSPGPWDYRRHCTAPLQLLPGGYMAIRKDGKGWTQVTDQSEREAPAEHGPLPPIGPRHDAGPRFRMRAEGHALVGTTLPAWAQ